MVGLIDIIRYLFLSRKTSEMFPHFLIITKTTQPRPLSFSRIFKLIVGFHMTAQKFKLKNYRSYRNFNFTMH